MVLEKIREIMAELSHIGKDIKISYDKVNYPALTETHLLEVIRPKLIEHGIVMFPNQVTHLEVNGKITTIAFVYQVTDTNDNDTVFVASVGQGQDSGDKGAGKAATYANKYAILKLFQLAQKEDDPDIRSSAEIADEEEAIKVNLSEAAKILKNLDLEADQKASLEARIKELKERASLNESTAALNHMKKLAKS